MLNRQGSIKVKDFLKLTHEDLKKRDAIEITKHMQKELGFKCVNSSYYLKDSLDSFQKRVSIAMRNNDSITEDTELWLHDEWLMANEGTNEVEILMTTHVYHEMLLQAIIREAKNDY